MKTAKNVQLNCREFGAGVVAAPALERWLKTQDWPGLVTLLPNSENPAFVQVEHLLCAIEGARFADLTAAEALALVPPSALAAFAVSVGLCAEELKDKGLEHWLAGAAVHSDMRDRLRLAFGAGDLQLLDGFTLAPKVAATARQPASPKPLQRRQAQEDDVLVKLRELGFDPLALPLPPKPGAPSPAKMAARAALNYSKDVMNKAWQRLRDADQIKDTRP